jgi:hypothetical protein
VTARIAGALVIQSPGAQTLIPDLADCPAPATEDRPIGETREYHPTPGKTLLLASAWMPGSGSGGEPPDEVHRFIYTVALDITAEQSILGAYRNNLLLVLIAGSVTIESELQRGTSVRLMFPVPVNVDRSQILRDL